VAPFLGSGQTIAPLAFTDVAVTLDDLFGP
jgi:hypothetical protein